MFVQTRRKGKELNHRCEYSLFRDVKPKCWSEKFSAWAVSSDLGIMAFGSKFLHIAFESTKELIEMEHIVLFQQFLGTSEECKTCVTTASKAIPQ